VESRTIYTFGVVNITGEVNYLEWSTDQNAEDWSSYDEIERVDQAVKTPPPEYS
jgi:hypothetical protein